jgi:hypothetical protein
MNAFAETKGAPGVDVANGLVDPNPNGEDFFICRLFSYFSFSFSQMKLLIEYYVLMVELKSLRRIERRI